MQLFTRAVETWRSQHTYTAPVLPRFEPSHKRGRSLSSSSSRTRSISRSQCSDSSWGFRTPFSQRLTGPPKIKRHRVNDYSDHQSRLVSGNHNRHDEFVHTDNRCVSPWRFRRSLSPASNQSRSRVGNPSLQRSDHHFRPHPRRYPFPTDFRESRPKGRDGSSPSQHRRSPPFQGSRERYGPSPAATALPPLLAACFSWKIIAIVPLPLRANALNKLIVGITHTS